MEDDILDQESKSLLSAAGGLIIVILLNDTIA